MQENSFTRKEPPKPSSKSDKFSIVSRELINYSKRILSDEEYSSIHNNFRAVEESYNNIYMIMSTSFFTPSIFKNWKKELLENLNKIMPLLISKMILGELCAGAIYHNISGQDHGLPELDFGDFSWSHGEEPAIIKQASLDYLASEHAANLFKETNNEQVLCEVNHLLGQINLLANCSGEL